MKPYILRADITVTGPSAGVLHFATRGYGTTAAHAALPNTWFDGRLVQPLRLRRSMFGERRAYGDFNVDTGDVVLQNSDGALDHLRLCGFDAQKIKIVRVDPADLDSEETVFEGVMEDALLNESELRILVRDLSYLFDRPLQPTKYAGTNVLPNGLEGTANDLKGKPKPIRWGALFNFEPDLVNTSRDIYQLHDVALGTGYTMTVYDKRVALAAGILRTLADMQNGAVPFTVSAIDTATDIITFTGVHSFLNGEPVHVASTGGLPGGVLDSQYYYARSTAADKITLHPTEADALANTNIVNITSAGSGAITIARNRTPYGRYDWCSDGAGSYIRTGLRAARLTMDLTNPSPSGSSNWYAILSDLLNRYTTAILDNQVTSTYSVIGVNWTEEMTVLQAIRDILRNIGATCHRYPYDVPVPPTQALTVRRLQAPAASAVFELNRNNIIAGTLKKIRPADGERGIPPWRVNVNYKRNWTVMSASELVGTAPAEITFAAQAYRTAKAENAGVTVIYPAAPELLLDTNLSTEADGIAHATYMRDLHATTVPRQMFSVEVALQPDQGPGLMDFTFLSLPSPFIRGLMLGDTVLLTYPRFDLDAGQYFVVIGYELDFAAAANRALLILWG